jgi:ferredoxin
LRGAFVSPTIARRWHSHQLTYIDPDVCIDCGACIPACPVRAIYEVIDMPDDQRHWIEINAERARALPVVYAKQEPLPTAAARRAQLGF